MVLQPDCSALAIHATDVAVALAHSPLSSLRSAIERKSLGLPSASGLHCRAKPRAGANTCADPDSGVIGCHTNRRPDRRPDRRADCHAHDATITRASLARGPWLWLRMMNDSFPPFSRIRFGCRVALTCLVHLEETGAAGSLVRRRGIWIPLLPVGKKCRPPSTKCRFKVLFRRHRSTFCGAIGQDCRQGSYRWAWPATTGVDRRGLALRCVDRVRRH